MSYFENINKMVWRLNIYKNVIDVQDACNLSGVVQQFARDMILINRLTKDINEAKRHQVAILYAFKITSLVGLDIVCDNEEWNGSYDECVDKAFGWRVRDGEWCDMLAKIGDNLLLDKWDIF